MKEEDYFHKHNFLEIFKIEFICLQGSRKSRKMSVQVRAALQDPKGTFEERRPSVGSKGHGTFTNFFFTVGVSVREKEVLSNVFSVTSLPVHFSIRCLYLEN